MLEPKGGGSNLVMKRNLEIPSEDALRQMVSPEMVRRRGTREREREGVCVCVCVSVCVRGHAAPGGVS